MSIKPPPPDIVIGRLPIYLRALTTLAQENAEITSSYELGERLGISSAQIRKDFAWFGGFGKQGTGYQIQYLIEQLRHILKVDREWPMVVIGAGHMGEALVNYQGFGEHGFKIVAIFDNNHAKIGSVYNGYPVFDVAGAGDYVREHEIKIAMLATPAHAAQEIADGLIAAGVRSILNYAPVSLVVPKEVQVQAIDPVSKLQHMAYYLE